MSIERSEPKNTADIVIIGGGVIGLSIARSLSLRGVRDLVLLERGRLGQEASSAAAGMLAPQAEADSADEFFKLLCQSRDLYPSFAAALREESGIDIELDQTGTIYVAFNEEDDAENERRYEWQTEAGLPVERLSGDDARTFEPCISENVISALRFPKDTQVENRRLVSALAESCVNLGVHFSTSTTVEGLRIERDSIKGVETSQGFISTPAVVVAAGAWTSILTNSYRQLPDLQIEPVRGQMVCFESVPSLAHHVIYSRHGYLVPRMDGRLIAGSTSEHAGFAKQVTGAGIKTILSHAFEISPAVSKLPFIDCWSGLRPRAADGLPVLGRYAEIEGLVYATGHYRNGILLTPITGELIAEAILDQASSPALQAFTPDRFRSRVAH